MTDWKLTCPNCKTENTITKDEIYIDCGKLNCTCTCVNCSTEFTGETDYWKFLGLHENPLITKKKDL